MFTSFFSVSALNRILPDVGNIVSERPGLQLRRPVLRWPARRSVSPPCAAICRASLRPLLRHPVPVWISLLGLPKQRATNWLHKGMYLSQLWRLDVWNRGASRARLPLKALRKHCPCLFLALVAAGDSRSPWFVATSFHLHTAVFPLCMQLCVRTSFCLDGH